ncbi:MAG TPA: patatin-like phospholipase family protein [Acidobacteriota bacterium]|nr:patatin-like phospholipase family protein [Acidobacteriota bacterium]
MPPRLRSDLPYRRIAVVLSGGGALGAYEVGVLRAVRAAGLEPAVVSGASAGALNAVVWVAHGFDTRALEDVWRRLEPATIGMRWSALAWRSAGAFLVLYGGLEVALTIMGSPELSLAAWLQGRGVGGLGPGSVLLDAVAWLAVATAGASMLRGAGETEVALSAAWAPGRGRSAHRWIASVLVAWAALHVFAWGMGFPWPHRFSATLLAVATTIWLAAKPGRTGAWLRGIFARLLPESRGRGFWGGSARRKLLRTLVASGDAKRLVSGRPVVILSGLSLDNGRVALFVSGEEIGEEFRARADAALGEAIEIRTPEEVLNAAIASSSIPIFFEPSRVGGREFLDAVALSTHPLQAALFAGVDAALAVVVSPSGGPTSGAPPRNLVALWGRYLDIANWRDLQNEIRSLPADWRAQDTPRRLCLVEPEEPLPGGVLAYAPHRAEATMRRGEADAWRALERAGWLDLSDLSGGAQKNSGRATKPD